MWTCSAVRKCSEASLSPFGSSLVLLCRSCPAQFWWRLYSWWFWLIHQRTKPSCSPAVVSPGVTVLLGGEPSGLSEVLGAQEQALIKHLHSLLLERMVWGGVMFGGCFPPIMILRIKVETLNLGVRMSSGGVHLSFTICWGLTSSITRLWSTASQCNDFHLFLHTNVRIFQSKIHKYIPERSKGK